MKRSILHSIVILIVFTACEDPYKKVGWKLEPEAPRLVVEGGITNEYKAHAIYLKKTSEYFANTPAPTVSNATLTVSYDEQIYSFTEQNPGEYVSVDSFAGIAGNTYTLHIELPDALNNETSYVAKSTLIAGISIDSLACELYENTLNFGNTSDTTIAIFYVYGKEPAEYENHYIIKLYKNDTLLHDTIDEVSLSNDMEFEYNGAYVTSWFFFENLTGQDTIAFEISSVPKNYHDFISGIQQIAGGSDPFGFSGPPANPRGNIEGGEALGFFTASYVSRGTTVPADRRDE